MMSKLFALLACITIFLSPASASPTVTNGTLDARQSCGTPGSFCTTTPCCAGFFCSTTTQTCGSCQGPGAPCTGLPCCAGEFCGLNNHICGFCAGLGQSCANFPCCSGTCSFPGEVCH
ncbi:hypothetical protein B0H14DRAFT_2797139 [Mycena olivaceomarginata]|nr:hypothetical protein B0H14DRAFT_2797139 [Mycena olivaceomarginata]